MTIVFLSPPGLPGRQTRSRESPVEASGGGVDRSPGGPERRLTA